MLTLKGKIKKSIFLMGALSIGMTIATGCSNEDDLEQNQGNLTVVNATIDNGSGARTSVNELYQVVWNENDDFTVFNGDTKKGNMTLQGQGGDTTGEFEGTLSSVLTNDDVALFPAVTDNAKTYTFKSEYTSTETDAPLYGTYNGTSFTFSPLSAFIRVNVNHFTENTQYVLTITSTGEQALAGEATLSNDVLLPPIGQGKTITVTLTPEEGATFLTFDAPIPAQTYTGLSITLKAGDAEATPLRTLTDFTAVAGKLYETTQKVYDTETLKIALANGGNVDIGSSFSLTEDLEVTENTIIDLNNQTLDAAGKTITVAEGKNLTIQNAASLVRSASNATIKSDKDIIVAGNNSTIIIGEGVNLISTANCCVFVPYGVSGATITTAGNLTSQGNYAAIQANGYADNITVNVIGGTIKSACEGIYFPCTTDLNISGGTIEGTTAVYHKSGNLNISGGTLKATGVKADYVYNGNGCNATGDALVIEACNYPGGVPVVSITGGTFISENAKAIGYYKQSEDYALINESFITGGTFSDLSSINYLTTNANVDVYLTNDVIVDNNDNLTIPAGATVTLDINGKIISQTSAAAISMLTNKGTLTINDTNSNNSSGKIAFTFNGTVNGGAAANTISNRGTLVVNGGEIINTGTGNQIGYAIDNYNGAICTINGGKIKATGSSYYDGIRLFCGSNETDVTVNEGEVSSIWAQNPSNNKASEVKGTVVVNGGTITTVYYENYTTVKVKTGVTTTITPYGAGKDNTTSTTEGEYTVYSFVHSN